LYSGGGGGGGIALSGRGMTCSTRMGEPPGGDGVHATRPEGLDSDNDEKATGEEGQNGANNDQGWSSSGW
jgi:hypothetical protein